MRFNAGQLGGTVIGTSGSWGNNPGATKDAAFDGALDTFFDSPTANGAWVGLDLGTGRSARLTKIRFRPRAETDGNSKFAARMEGGQFQIANRADFSDAVTVFTIAAPPASDTLTEQPVSNPTPFRYVRYLSPNGSNGNVAELEFYGE